MRAFPMIFVSFPSELSSSCTTLPLAKVACRSLSAGRWAGESREKEHLSAAEQSLNELASAGMARAKQATVIKRILPWGMKAVSQESLRFQVST